MPRDEMRDRILRGAVEALAIYGTRRFSVSAVSERAGISRGTLYRYFTTKENLLAALTSHLGRDFRYFLKERVGEQGVHTSVSGVADAMLDYVEQTPFLTQLLDAEPVFVRAFYHEQFDGLVQLVATAIAPVYGSGERASRDALAAAEVMVRLAISYRIVGADAGPLPSGTLGKYVAESFLAPSTGNRG